MRLLLLSLLCLLSLPAVASACWNDVRLKTNEEVKALAAAEKQLQAGDAAGAIKTLRALYGRRAVLYPERVSSERALGQKARRLISIAIVRDGRLDPKTGRAAKVSRRHQLLKHALGWLRVDARRGKDDPLRQARYAEALSQDPAGAADARHLLEGLAQADLIAEAEGWRALARLRHGAGDAAGSKQAITRCTAMAGAARCALPAAGGS